jgi:non-specific serine/threonine protein kinase
VGKTRLAIAVAEAHATAFRDGVVFVPLAAISNPAQVLTSIARVFDIREMSRPSTVEDLIATLRHRQVLLVLDNVEHLLPAATDIGRLIANCPHLTVLATSREPLRLANEQRFPTPPLTLPEVDQQQDADVTVLAESEAVAFFVDRARWVQNDFALESNNAAAVSEICRRLDGLPLAIELAAAWMRVLTPSMLLERLEQRLPLLRGGPEHLPIRLRTMHNAIAWSYDLLNDDEARLFRALAIFAGGFTLEAAETVSHAVLLSGSAPTLDLLASLIDKNLIQTQTDGRFSRFLMLETVREFALAQLAAHGETASVAAAHAAWMAHFAEFAEPHLLGPDEREWKVRCDSELENLRAALTWSLDHNVECALRIGAALWLYWDWSIAAEGANWLRLALARATDEPVHVRARAFTTHAALTTICGDLATGTISLDQAIPLAREAGLPVTEGLATWVLGCTDMLTGNVEAAELQLDRALQLLTAATTSTVRSQISHVRAHRGVVAFLQGDATLGLACYERAMEQARSAKSDSVTLMMLGDYAGWLVDAGEMERAETLAREGLTLARDYVGWLAACPLCSLALTAALRGNMVLAARYLGAIDAARQHGGIDFPMYYVQRLDRAASLAQASLGNEVFAAERAEGMASLPAILAGQPADLGSPLADVDMTIDAPDGGSLTPRQRQVVALMVAGRSDRQIADELFISHRTASHHVAAILEKLNARTRGEAAVRAVQAGLI